jgi:hypothetical protein
LAGIFVPASISPSTQDNTNRKAKASFGLGVLAARLSFALLQDRRKLMHEKCQCQHCQGNIEFARDGFDEMGRSGDRIVGQYIGCPHCGKETVLSMPRPNYPAAVMVPAVAQNKSQVIETDANTGIENRLDAGAIAVLLIGVVSAILGVVAYLQFGQNENYAILGIAALFQSWIMSLFLFGFAEVIRLLRKR